MADVVFVYPRTGFDVKNVSVEIPLSVIHASSFLYANGYKIKIIDQRVDKNWEITLQNELKNKPLFVGISSMTGTQISWGLKAAKIVKESSETKIVWGGVHPSILPEETIKHPLVDIIVKGDGERTLLNLAEALGKKQGLENIKGIVYKESDKIIVNPDAEVEDLNNFPEIPYDLVDIEYYLKNNGRLFSTIYSRGCPFGCSFCCNPLLSKRKWRTLSTKRITEDMERIYNKYHFKILKFNDENFFVDYNRVEEISKFINNRYEWQVQARIDSVARFDYAELKKRGLSQIQPGIESGNDRILKLIKKQITVKDVIEHNRKLNETGIIATYNFMIGFPTETNEEIFDTVNLALQLLKENQKAEISGFYIYVPYPGCELYDLSLKQGFSPPQTLEGWAEFSRQQLYTPWIQDKKEMLKTIGLSSKFVDGRRINRIFEKTLIPRAIPLILSKIYQKRWQKKDFKNRIDLKMINFVINKMVKAF